VTRDVCLLARMMAANLHFSQIEELMFEVLLETSATHMLLCLVRILSLQVLDVDSVLYIW
jgi:hypothetical protein